MRQLTGTEWDRPELGKKGETPTGEFRVFDVFVPDESSDPQAYLVRSFSEAATVGIHFHEHPQFQVFVEGSGLFGRHDVAPVTVHFTDAYAVYGPIVAGEDGVSFFVFRAELDFGARYMPGSRDRLLRRGRRNLSVHVDQQQLLSEGRVTVFVDDDGLLGEVRRAEPSERLALPDATGSPACYSLVLAGSGSDSVRRLDHHSVVHRVDGDGPMSLTAGPDGLTVLSLRFPHVAAELEPASDR